MAALCQMSYSGKFRELDSNQRAPGPKPGRDASNPPRIKSRRQESNLHVDRLQGGPSRHLRYIGVTRAEGSVSGTGLSWRSAN
jgi:hypothetical protein